MLTIGILGAGRIARTMAATIRQMNGQGNDSVSLYAVASRDKDKADAFAKEFQIPHAFGSYESMLADPNLSLVYVATPHSHHFAHAKLCLEHGKHVLCEKAFTVNATQAEELCRLSEERGLLLAEAIWTRYQPMRRLLDELVGSGCIGEPTMLTASLGYAMSGKERIVSPELAGGALLDVGVYALNFAVMLFGHPDEVQAQCIKSDKGLDMQDSYTLLYRQKGRLAVLCASALGRSDRCGVIYGSTGYIVVENINNPQKLTVYDADYRPVREIPCPAQLTGYEYEVQEAAEAIAAGVCECPSMPHAETIRMMRLMDGIRRQFGLVYPCE